MSLGEISSVKRIITALTLSAVLASPAWSAYLQNKQQWDELLPTQQMAYAIGVYDQLTQRYTSDTKAQLADKERKSQCARDAGLTIRGMADLINTMYRNNVDLWGQPPNIALYQGLNEMCY